jgi:hypothetical protein
VKHCVPDHLILTALAVIGSALDKKAIQELRASTAFQDSKPEIRKHLVVSSTCGTYLLPLHNVELLGREG